MLPISSKTKSLDLDRYDNLPVTFRLLWKLKAFNWSVVALCSLATLALYVHLISFLQIQTISNGEALSLVNIPIEFALHNKIHYPLHGQDHFYPGIETLVTHPPLHYYLAGWLFRFVGVGRWQIQLLNLIVGLSLILLTVTAAKKLYGNITSLTVAFLSIIFYGLYFAEHSGRPDLTLGLIYGLFLLTLYKALWSATRQNYRLFLSFLLGILAVAMMASHWNGIFVFLYFPFYLLLLARRQESWLKHGALLATGVTMAFIPWLMLYRSDFFIVIFSAYIGGARRFQTLTPEAGQNFLNFFQPLTAWNGGWLLSAGLLFGFGFCTISMIQYVWHRSNQTISEQWMTKVDWLLLSSLMGYFFFYLIFIRNRHPQYMANIYFLLLLFSARGYALLWDFSQKYIVGKRILYSFIVVAIIVSGGYYLKNNVAWVNPLTLEHPNKTYNATRQALIRFVDSHHQIFMGVQIYHYLYDYPYKTNRAVEIETLKRRVYKEDFPSIAQRRELAKEAGDIMIVRDSNYMFQFRFFDERVWYPNFKKVATVSGDTILYRNDVAEELFNALNLTPNTTGCNENIWWAVYDPFNDAPSGITNMNWNDLSPVGKEKAVRDYLDRHGWFGQPKSTVEKNFNAFFEEVDTYLQWVGKTGWRSDLGIQRSLEQAIDVMVIPDLASCPS